MGRVRVVRDDEDFVNAVYLPPADMDEDEADDRIVEAIECARESEDWDYDDVTEALEVLGFKSLDFKELYE